MQTRRSLIQVSAISGSESLTDDKWSVHDDSEVAVAPAYGDMREGVLGRDFGGLGKIRRDALNPRLDALFVKFHKLFSAR